MKKIIIIAIALILILFFITSVKDGKLIRRVNNYRVFSNAGKVIPATLYVERNQDSDSVVYLLMFNKSLKFKNDHSILFIDISGKFIGIPELSSGEIINLGNRYAFQNKKIPNVIGAIGTEFFLDDKILDYANFKENKIIFNTYGPLKKYGDSVIVEIVK